MLDITITVNGEERSIAHRSTIADVVALALGVPAEKVTGVAVAVADRVVPRSAWETTSLEAGARIELVTATQGG